MSILVLFDASRFHFLKERWINEYKKTEENNLIMSYIENVAFISCVLNFSFPSNLHTKSIIVVFFNGLYYFVLWMASGFNAFSTYPHNA